MIPVLKPLPHRIAYANRRLQRESVTLVAGFKCKNGVVICADTQHTGNYVKFAAPKLWTDRSRTIVAGACNDVVYLKMAVDELSTTFEHLKQWTEISIRKAISDTLATVHKAIRAAFGMKDQQPQLFLMIGARLDDWKAILMTTSATAVATVNEFDFIGAGEEVARLLISPFYDSNLRVTEMQRIAAYCFRYAKVSGSWSGGDTHVGTIWDGDPDVGYAHPAMIHRDKEVVSVPILNKLAPALSAAWNINVNREEFEKRVDNLVSWLRLLREQQEKVDRPDVLITSGSKPLQ
jgi:20S proteasome alpha/beta subunit